MTVKNLDKLLGDRGPGVVSHKEVIMTYIDTYNWELENEVLLTEQEIEELTWSLGEWLDASEEFHVVQ